MTELYADAGGGVNMSASAGSVALLSSVES
ncbi:hypothetical protein J2S70_001125 [Trueperella bonasi]|uniref:Uncharacterized protein n=1 Tax=Trueperella bonasi TaxID=312286 RepID=A0ABT9NGL0_9ACTO|nr:hypothetical protein [Trueperella bonasi]